MAAKRKGSAPEAAPAGLQQGANGHPKPGPQIKSGSSVHKAARNILLAIAVACFSTLIYSVLQTNFRASRPSTPQPPRGQPPQPQESLSEEEALARAKAQAKHAYNQWRPEPSLQFRQRRHPQLLSPEPSKADLPKREAVKNALKSSWAAYVQDAWGADEYHPISHAGTNLSVDGGMGYTIVDSLDTLLIFGEQTEYNRARDWVKANLHGSASHWKKRGKFNVFETVIRTLGGLLSAHALCTETPSNLEGTSPFFKLCDPSDAQMYLETAVELARHLQPAFETQSGIPQREVDFAQGQAYGDADNGGAASLAEATTLQLEYKYLSWLTGDSSYWQIAERPMTAVLNAGRLAGQDGLLPIFLNVDTGLLYLSPIRLGSRGDSYYEYLIKQYIQTNRSEKVYRGMFDRSVSGIKKHLVKQSTFSQPPFLYVAEMIPRPTPQETQRDGYRMLPKQDHLVCFLAGAMMLSATSHAAPQEGWPAISPEHRRNGGLSTREEDWTVGHELLRSCVTTYQETSTGLGPEIAFWRAPTEKQAQEEDWYIKSAPAKQRGKAVPLIDARNILRPETVESLFVAFHLTGDPIYREWGWEIFQAFETHCKLPNGAFAGIKDVDAEEGDVQHEDKMETFWLSETLKYLYLLFDDQSTLPLDQWVLNTEAHPLPIFQPSEPTSVD